MRHKTRLGALLLALPLALAACSDDSTSPRVPSNLVVVAGGGDAQVGETVTLTVQVNDEAGHGLPDVPVTWQIVDGGGSLTPASGISDEQGRVSTTWTLGTTAGEQVARASVQGISPAMFQVVAAPGELAAVVANSSEIVLQAIGQKAQLLASGVDAYGNAISSVALAWESLDPSIVSVTGNGQIEALKNGETKVVVSSGALADTIDVEVQQAPAKIVMTPANDTISVGDTLAIEAVAFDANDVEIEGAPITWTSSNDSIASVDEEGNVVGRVDGFVTITATSGAASATTELLVQARLVSIVISAAQDTILVEGEVQLTAQGINEIGGPFLVSEFEWASSDETTATVDQNGYVTSYAGGTTTITAKADTIVGEFELVVRGRIHDGNLSSSETWLERDSPHWVTKDIWVYGSASPTLTIEAGAEVRFYRDASLTVAYTSTLPGTLKVEGTAEKPVLFTSDAASPEAGDWGGIDFRGSTTNETSIAHATFEYCGGEGVGACLKVRSGARIGVESVTIRESDGYGARLEGTASFGNGSSDLSVHNTADYAIFIGANQAGSLPEGGSFSGGAGNAVWIKGETVNSTQTWPNLGIPYVVSGDRVYVYSSTQPTLTIPAGTELRFLSGGGIEVGYAGVAGTLKVEGTATDPVLMTSNAASPVAGSWRGIYITNAATDDNVIEHTTMSYCGDSGRNACLRVQSSTVTVKDVTLEHSGMYGAHLTHDAQFGLSSSNLTVRHSGEHAVRLDANRVGTLPLGGDYTNNGAEGIFIHPGTVSRTQTWNDPGVPYVIGNSAVYVYSSTSPTLTLVPGLEFRMSSSAQIQVGYAGNAGTLIAQGTADKPIVFTANSATPQPGYWNRILFSNHATVDSRLSYVVAEYGTNNIHFNGTIPGGTLEGLTIRHADECGVRFQSTGTPPDLKDPALNNTFENNGTDICS